MAKQQTFKWIGTLLGPITRRSSAKFFPGSREYWEQRYETGDDSGLGSYGQLAAFKAEVINDFVKRKHIQSVLEFGCGDGNQLSLAQYPSYIGLDVAPKAIEMCVERFEKDPTKSFFLYSSQHFKDRSGILSADLTMSLDVIFHLVEDDIFQAYMRHLFAAATKYVIVYASDDERPDPGAHVRHRQFTSWIETNLPEWQLIDQIQNPHQDLAAAVADFYIYERTAD
jgi:SAM-dependent methyltransferase